MRELSNSMDPQWTGGSMKSVGSLQEARFLLHRGLVLVWGSVLVMFSVLKLLHYTDEAWMPFRRLLLICLGCSMMSCCKQDRGHEKVRVLFIIFFGFQMGFNMQFLRNMKPKAFPLHMLLDTVVNLWVVLPQLVLIDMPPMLLAMFECAQVASSTSFYVFDVGHPLAFAIGRAMAMHALVFLAYVAVERRVRVLAPCAPIEPWGRADNSSSCPPKPTPAPSPVHQHPATARGPLVGLEDHECSAGGSPGAAASRAVGAELSAALPQGRARALEARGLAPHSPFERLSLRPFSTRNASVVDSSPRKLPRAPPQSLPAHNPATTRPLPPGALEAVHISARTARVLAQPPPPYKSPLLQRYQVSFTITSKKVAPVEISDETLSRLRVLLAARLPNTQVTKPLVRKLPRISSKRPSRLPSPLSLPPLQQQQEQSCSEVLQQQQQQHGLRRLSLETKILQNERQQHEPTSQAQRPQQKQHEQRVEQQPASHSLDGVTQVQPQACIAATASAVLQPAGE